MVGKVLGTGDYNMSTLKFPQATVLSENRYNSLYKFDKKKQQHVNMYFPTKH